MDDSFQLLSSMSPKFSKNKASVKKKAPTKLALNKLIRRSSIYDKLPSTINNLNISVVDRLTESSETNSDKKTIIIDDSDLDEENVKLINSTKDDTIIIPNSDESDTVKISENKEHIYKNITVRKRNVIRNSRMCNLNKENLQHIEPDSLSATKYNAIQKWISNIEVDKDEIDDVNILLEFSHISSIQSDATFKEFVPPVNSTFVGDNCQRFDELFKPKSNNKISGTKSSKTSDICKKTNVKKGKTQKLYNVFQEKTENADNCAKFDKVFKQKSNDTIPEAKSSKVTDISKKKIQKKDKTLKSVILDNVFQEKTDNTFVGDNCPKFDELKQKSNNIPETKSLKANDIMKKTSEKNCKVYESIILDNVFQEKSNKTLKKNVEINKNRVSGNQENNKNLLNDIQDDKNLNVILDSPKNDLNPSKNEDKTLEHEKMLDEIYGKQWRQNKDKVLPMSEPRKKQKVKSRIMPQTEIKRKPRTSITHKNPYLDSEQQKSTNLLKSLQMLRVQATIESPYFRRFKELGDSETDSFDSPRIKLNFDSENSVKKKDTFANYRSKRSPESSPKLGSSDKNNEFSDFSDNSEGLGGKINKAFERTRKSSTRKSESNSDDADREVSRDFKAGKTECETKQTNSDDSFEDIDLCLTDKLKKKHKSHRKSIREKLKRSILEESFSDFSDIGESLEDKLKKKAIDSKLVQIKQTTLSTALSDCNDSTKINKHDANGTNANLETKFNDILYNVFKTVDPTPNNDMKTKDVKLDKGAKKVNEKVQKKIIEKVPKKIIEDTKKPKIKRPSKKVAYISDSSSSSSYSSFKTPAVPRFSTKGPQSFLASLSKSVPDANSDASAKLFRNCYKNLRAELLVKLFTLYNEQIFDNCIPDDAPFEWSDRMTGTAGYCYCRKITRRTGVVERKVRFVLATKVLDSADRLRDTLVHEMCHAATWIVNCVSDGHGQFWKAWANKAMNTFPELPPIKRCHDYTVNTKYTYKCTECGYSFGRHSKSLNILTKRCGHCSGKFEILINKTTKAGVTKSLPVTPKKEATGFALFVKENYSVYKNPRVKHGDVMRLLGQKFQELKVDKK